MQHNTQHTHSDSACSYHNIRALSRYSKHYRGNRGKVVKLPALPRCTHEKLITATDITTLPRKAANNHGHRGTTLNNHTLPHITAENHGISLYKLISKQV